MATINWQDVLTNLAVVTGGGTVLVGASAWLIKTVVTHRLETDADKFRTQIKADADIEIERLKSSLQIVATEHQIRFTKLHERRAEIIAELYKKLSELHHHGEYFVLTRENNPDPAKDQEFRKMQQELADFAQYYRQSQIYLPEGVCSSLEALVAEIRGNVWAAGVFGRIKNPNVHTLLAGQDAFTKGYAAFEEKIPEARRALENEFRKLLGVENDERVT